MTAKDSGTSADALQRSIEGTVFNSTLRKNVGEGVLDYEVYLNTNELLALQTPFAALSAPDELLFQVVHQTQELWMKQLTFEAVNLVRAMDGAKFPAIVATLHRMLVIARGLGDQIRILQTMPPDVFQVVRRQLGNGSGLGGSGPHGVGGSPARWRARGSAFLVEEGRKLCDLADRPWGDAAAFEEIARVDLARHDRALELT